MLLSCTVALLVTPLLGRSADRGAENLHELDLSLPRRFYGRAVPKVGGIALL